MKHLILVLLMIVGCTLMTPVKHKTEVTPQDNEPEEVIVSKPVELPPLKLVPNTKYRVTNPTKYAALLPRVQKFWDLAVNEKSLLDGVKFNMTRDTAEQIRQKIVGGFDIEVKTYTTKWAFSDVVAYHDDWHIYFNTRKIDKPYRNDCAVINTFVHESLHGLSYAHSSGTPNASDRLTVPYWMGEKAEELCKAGLI